MQQEQKRDHRRSWTITRSERRVGAKAGYLRDLCTVLRNTVTCAPVRLQPRLPAQTRKQPHRKLLLQVFFCHRSRLPPAEREHCASSRTGVSDRTSHRPVAKQQPERLQHTAVSSQRHLWSETQQNYLLCPTSTRNAAARASLLRSVPTTR